MAWVIGSRGDEGDESSPGNASAPFHDPRESLRCSNIRRGWKRLGDAFRGRGSQQEFSGEILRTCPDFETTHSLFRKNKHSLRSRVIVVALIATHVLKGMIGKCRVNKRERGSGLL